MSLKQEVSYSYGSTPDIWPNLTITVSFLTNLVYTTVQYNVACGDCAVVSPLQLILWQLWSLITTVRRS